MHLIHYPYRFEYLAITGFYENKTAKRSGVPLINHIHEGLLILTHLHASELTMGAYCLHPIFQSDEAIKDNIHTYCYDFTGAQSLIYVIEYRSVANEYLSKRKINSIEEIRLSPIPEVNQMLIADKVQNYKDFELYHKDTHERSEELDEYFNNWLRRLGISKEDYQKLKTIIS